MSVSVTHVLWNGEIGGIQRLVADLSAAQARDGGDVAVAFARPGGPFYDAVREAGVAVHDLDMRSGYDLAPGRAARVARLLAERAVVHLHGFNLPIALAARRSRRAVVYTEHGFTTRTTWRARAKGEAHRRFLLGGVDRVVANSAFTADRLAERRRVPRERVDVVHNGIDAAGLPEAGPPPGGEGVTVACVGRLVDWKRLDLAVDAVAAAPGARLLVVGDGPERARLEARAAAAGLGARVEFLGVRRDVPQVMGRADVLLQTSFEEWFGLAVAEGCAMGLLPVVLTDAGGALEVLPEDGVVVPRPDALGPLLAGLKGDPRLAAGARLARARWARERFSIGATADGYARVYRLVSSRT